MPDFGGIMRFTFGGRPLVVRGKLTTEPASQRAEKIVNQDGSIGRAMSPKGYGGEVTFEDSSEGQATALDWNAILLGGPYNFSIVEDTTGVVHAYTGAVFTGDVKVDRMNGEVTGLEIHSPSYSAKST